MAVQAEKSNSATDQTTAGAPLDGEVLPAATKIEIGAATMLGDMRDPILDVIRLMDKPWSKMHAHEQRRVVDGVERICRESVSGMVSLFARITMPSVPITIGPLSAKDETLTVKITCEKSDEAALSLLNTPRAMIVFADEKAFMGEREAAAVDPDQPNIPFPEDKAETAGAQPIDPVTGESETAPGGIPLDEAERRFEASKEAAEEKKARTRQRRGTTAASEPEPEEGEAEMPDAPAEPVEA